MAVTAPIKKFSIRIKNSVLVKCCSLEAVAIHSNIGLILIPDPAETSDLDQDIRNNLYIAMLIKVLKEFSGFSRSPAICVLLAWPTQEN
jgi:hypothetical protein